MDRIELFANEGMILTDGVTFGRQIILADGVDANKFYEITEAEYDELTASEDIIEGFTNVTEEDYQVALRDMGVEI